MEFSSGHGEIFPCAEFLAAYGAVGGVRLEGVPFFGCAIEEDSFAILTPNDHVDYLASERCCAALRATGEDSSSPEKACSWKRSR